MKKLGFLPQEEINDRISLSNQEAAKLSFYRNNISHLLIFESLICGFFQYQKEILKEDLIESLRMIYPFLKEEFFLKWEESELEQLIDSKIKKLMEKGLILDDTEFLKDLISNRKNSMKLKRLENLFNHQLIDFMFLSLNCGKAQMNISQKIYWKKIL